METQAELTIFANCIESMIKISILIVAAIFKINRNLFN